MIQETVIQQNAAPAPGFAGPTKQQIVKATLVALAVAVVILFTAVLPAEYGIDPLHTGAALGLTNLAKSNGAGSAAAPREQVSVQSSVESNPTIVAGTNGEAPTIKGVYVEQPHRYKIDSREINLQSGEGMEIKYHMTQKAGMVYSWTASKKVQYEFHGEPDTKPAGAVEDYFESYEKDDQAGKEQSNGTFTAPSTGIHGWFWENRSGGPVTIKLVTAGFYDYIMQNKDDVKTHLQPSDPK
jgi:hypothetical protein